MEFYGSYTALTVKDAGKKYTLIVAKFNVSPSQEKFHAYIDTVAEKLNAMEAFSDEMAEYLQAVKVKVQTAQLAERCLEEVTFQ